MKMNACCLAVLFLSGLSGMSPVQAVDHGSHTAAPAKEAGLHKAGGVSAPRLILDAPRADFLKKGYVFLPFRVENMTILPMYAEIHGEEITRLKPAIGHLHVKVDDNAWSWIHGQTDPIYFSTLPAGVHHMTVELADAAHNVIDTQTIELRVP